MDFKDTANKIQEYIERRFVTGGNRIDEAYAYAMENPGKMLRPLMTIAVARAYGVREEEYTPVAAMVEMLNNATLVLDDTPYMDNADLRRAKSTTWKKFGPDAKLGEKEGVATASMVPMYAFGEIMKILSSVDLDPKVKDNLLFEFGETSIQLTRGQEIDLHNLKPMVTQAKTIIDCYKNKTGSLFSCAVAVGAHLGKASDLEINNFRRFGSFFGTAYQIADELLDYLKTEEVGKSTGRDGEKATLINTSNERSTRNVYLDFIEAAEVSLPKSERDFSELQEIVRVARQKMEESLFSKKAVEQNGQQVRSS